METVNMQALVDSIKTEKAQQTITKREPSIQKPTGRSLMEKVAGTGLVKEAEDANAVADDVGSKLGISLNISKQLEKVAQQMEVAQTPEQIVKIASGLGNSDLAHIDTIANKLTDLVIAQVENRINR